MIRRFNPNPNPNLDPNLDPNPNTNVFAGALSSCLSSEEKKESIRGGEGFGEGSNDPWLADFRETVSSSCPRSKVVRGVTREDSASGTHGGLEG